MSTMRAHDIQPSPTPSNENVPSHPDPLFLEGSHPEGISLDHLPLDTQRLLELALPEEGLRVLAHLLRYATLQPSRTLPPLWAARVSEPSDQPPALVIVRSLKALAHTSDSPCGADRYFHLVTICEALGIVSRRVHRLGSHYATVLLITLHPCRLTPSVLLHCQELERRYRNPRLGRFLRQVQARLQSHLSVLPAPEAPSTFHSGGVEVLLTHMRQLVEGSVQRGIPQADLLQLIEQMLRLVLQHSARLSLPVSTHTPPGRNLTHRDRNVPHALDRVLPQESRNLPVAETCTSEHPAGFSPHMGRNLSTKSSVRAAETCPPEQKSGFLPHTDRNPTEGRAEPRKPGRNLTTTVSMSDSLVLQKKRDLEREALIDQEQQGSPRHTAHASPAPMSAPMSRQMMTTSAGHPLSPETQESRPEAQLSKQGPAFIHPSQAQSGSMSHASDALAVRSSPPSAQSASLTRSTPESIPGPGEQMGMAETRQATQTVQAETRPRAAETSQEYHDPRNHAEIRREAAYYAQLLDGQDRWIGKLVRCVQLYPAPIRHLAVVDTLYRCYEPDWRGRPKSPGAWFCRTCERFAMREEEIPRVVRRWAATSLTYEQMAALFEQGHRRPEQVEWDAIPAPSVPGTFMNFSEHREGRDATIPSGEKRLMHPSVALAQEHLEYEAATALAAQVMEALAAAGKHGTAEVLQESSGQHWMVLLVWEDGLEVPLLNEGEWKQYWNDVQYCTALQRSLGEANGARQATISRSW
ncbi:hypothetical protein [Reticulibacter mediterranei]|uniref:hypothetical protein n=1 Tax=Reticulibacter mediterranei TaxID=2778369 RepID=UPI001C68BDFD|nr:hypothetical protein [Reticulibacter mediterranei]